VRREFQLPEGDEEGLEARGLPWESVLQGGSRWLLIHDFPIPDGYTHRVATAALRIPPSYPDDQIDMVYFSPALALASGQPIGALTLTTIDGQAYQQWSRHRTAANPWRPGLDDIGTHLLQVESWLNRELARTP
jgi:hypothetical protein